MEEKQSVGNTTVCDEKDPVKPDINVENVQLSPNQKIRADVPETTRLRNESNEGNVSVAEQTLVDAKGKQIYPLRVVLFLYLF